MEKLQQAKVAQKVLKGTKPVSSSGSWDSAGAMASSKTISSKENTRPQDFKLHTQQRAAKRAIFNHFVAAKVYLDEQQRRVEKKVLKIIKEEEIRSLRKEMVFKAQLMPYFDRPFFPQRLNRPSTTQREPSIHMLGSRC